MWTSRLFWKLFLVYGGLNFAVAAMFPLLLSSWQESLLVNQVQDRLEGMALILRAQVEDDLVSGKHDRLDSLARRLAREAEVRVTLVAADGTVIADSDEDIKIMQNHSNRAELIAAAENGKGSSIRRSPTLGIRMLYAAIPVKQNEQLIAFVRLAVRLDTLDEQLRQRQRMLWLCTFGVAVLAAPITYLIVRSIAQPLTALTASARAIRSGDYKRAVPLRSRGELGELGTAFDQMRVDLASRVAELEENNMQMSTVLGGMVEGVLAVDAKRRVLLANRACRSLLAITSPQVAGRNLLEVVRNGDVDAAVNEALTSDQPHTREITLIGPPRRVLSLFATKFAAGSNHGAIVVMHDMSELRRLENLRREFVANVSHELKTPLASIKAYAETLRMGAINDKEHNLGFVDRIAEQAEYLHQLILDLLHLARVEAGQEAFQLAAVDLAPAVERCVTQVKQLAEQKNILLTIVSPANPAKAWADSDAVFTILSNLVGNAVKYTPTDGRVEVRWWLEDGEVIVEVQDTGIGIAKEDQQRIFERFYRVHKARSRELGGTGLGLAIVKHLSQSFGGSVALTSEINQGSIFRVTLPAASS
ncbi:MAG: HAMP domain-containing protein [Planctomycetaceae bacterium]|nr:HAMP domain-containing protein [Planctomycetales bacterium]MCB9923742.1 HAMP domain-containing protein [Planctomycetaceae bacterium]